jgi:hypothetical protein
LDAVGLENDSQRLSDYAMSETPSGSGQDYGSQAAPCRSETKQFRGPTITDDGFGRGE